MTRGQKRWVTYGGGTALGLWMASRPRFDGLSLLVVLGCCVGIVVLWRSLERPRAVVRCPHCRDRLHVWSDPAKRRGDGW